MDYKCIINVEEKQKYIEDLNNYTESVDKVLMETCTVLGWDLEKTIQKTEPFVTCPFNQSHKVPERTIEKHLQKCEWKTLGYTNECIPLPDSSLPLESPSTIKIDMILQHQILQAAKLSNPALNIGLDEKFPPKTSNRFFSDFTTDERRVIYDYVIANTVGPDTGDNITTEISNPDQTKEKEPSKAIIELLAAERNLKRRRAKYRGVHTNKKSHVEIMKEIIEQQMEMLREHISEKFQIPNPDQNDENNSFVMKNEKNKSETKYNSSDKDYYSDKDLNFSKNLDHTDKDYSSRKKFSLLKTDFNESYKKQSYSNSSEKFLNKDRDVHDFSKNRFEKKELSNVEKSPNYKKHSRHDKNRDDRSDKDSYKSDSKRERMQNKKDRDRIRNHNNRDRNRDKRKHDKSRHKHEFQCEKLSKKDSRDKYHKACDSNKKHHKHKSSRKHKRSRSKSRSRSRDKHKKSKHE